MGQRLPLKLPIGYGISVYLPTFFITVKIDGFHVEKYTVNRPMDPKGYKKT